MGVGCGGAAPLSAPQGHCYGNLVSCCDWPLRVMALRCEQCLLGCLSFYQTLRNLAIVIVIVAHLNLKKLDKLKTIIRVKYCTVQLREASESILVMLMKMRRKGNILSLTLNKLIVFFIIVFFQNGQAAHGSDRALLCNKLLQSDPGVGIYLCSSRIFVPAP